MQLDVIDSVLTCWAWPAGGPVPTEPLGVIIDNTVSQGKVAIEMGTASGGIRWVDDPTPRSTAVRYIHISDTHIPIPEQSSLLLASFVGMLCCCWRRR